MIDQPFTLPTLQNGALKDIDSLYRMSADEQTEWTVMMLMKYGEPATKYQITCLSTIYSNEYFVSPEQEDTSYNPIAQLTLPSFRLVYERMEFNSVESNSAFDIYKTRPLPLVDLCEFLYGLTRRGTIDAMLEEL